MAAKMFVWWSVTKAEFLSRDRAIFASSDRTYMEKFMADNPRLSEHLQLEIRSVEIPSDRETIPAQDMFKDRREEDSGEEG